MSPLSPGAEDPIKYTKESLAGLRDVWLGFAKVRLSKAGVTLQQLSEKLPPALKRKRSQASTTTTTDSSSANAPS